MARLSFSLDAAVLPMPSLSPTDLIRRKLDGPPPVEFDCGRDAQSRYFHDRAWVDQQQWLTTTYVYYLDGVAAAFATVCMDSVMLGTREKSGSIPYKWVSSLKLAQLGVDVRFQRLGLGAYVVAGVLAHALDGSRQFGCRYLNLDAQPDLVAWYESQGFRINKIKQKERMQAAAGRRDLADLPVSMRFDLFDLR